jgi:uncharacterized protein (DUF2336 family)
MSDLRDPGLRDRAATTDNPGFTLLELGSMVESRRVRLAADTSSPAALLLALAADKALTVRAAIAMNPAAGGDILGAIVLDPDERIRALLAHRLAMLLPSLTQSQLAPLQAQALATLHILVADEAIRVRAAIADVVKEMSDIPHELVLQLAHDIAVAVSEPVIRLSPLLNTEDLLALVSQPVSPATLISVARRPYLAGQVADTIAASCDVAAIAALLDNRSAAINETTLDRLIDRAAEHTDWQTKLVRWPSLSAAATRALAEFVVDDALGELSRRTDLPPGLADRIASKLTPVLTAGPSASASLRPRAPSLLEAIEAAQALAKAGQLTEDATMAAARRGEVRSCIAMLSVAACLSASAVERASSLRSSKGLISLIWRAGFSMRCAGMLQTLLLRMPPDSVLHPSPVGGFPLTQEEMRWQVDFLIRIAGPAGGGGRYGSVDQPAQIGRPEAIVTQPGIKAG